MISFKAAIDQLAEILRNGRFFYPLHNEAKINKFQARIRQNGKAAQEDIIINAKIEELKAAQVSNTSALYIARIYYIIITISINQPHDPFSLRARLQRITAPVYRQGPTSI